MCRLQESRAVVLAGAAPRSVASMKSGIRTWVRFAQKVLHRTGKELPPTIDELMAWSRLFRHSKTFSNYCSHVRAGCLLAQVDDSVFDNPLLRKARAAIDKRMGFRPRRKMYLRINRVRDIVRASNGGQVPESFAMLCSVWVGQNL